MPEHIRMQELTTLSAAVAQDIDRVADVTPYRTVGVQIRVAVAGVGTVFLEQSDVLDDAAFAAIVGASFDLSVAGPKSILIKSPSRYLRWRAAWTSGAPAFTLDAIAREAI